MVKRRFKNGDFVKVGAHEFGRVVGFFKEDENGNAGYDIKICSFSRESEFFDWDNVRKATHTEKMNFLGFGKSRRSNA